LIKAVIYKESEDRIIGFQLSGHAGYAQYGKDIVCSAVSALAINVVNSIEQLTADVFKVEQKDGLLKFRLMSNHDDGTQLLLQSFVLGLEEIARSESKYIKIIFRTREV